MYQVDVTSNPEGPLGASQLSDQDLLRAARAMVTEEGAESLTMDRLAQGLGISRATLYRRLGSRRAILEALGEEGSESGEDIEGRILQAARVVFTRDGLQGATIDAIAEEAGVGPATIYRRFEGREGLLRAFMESVRPNAALESLELTEGVALEIALTTFAEAALRHLTANQDIFLLFIAERRRPMSPLAAMPGLNPGRTVARLEAYFESKIRDRTLADDSPGALAVAFILPLLGEAVLRPPSPGRQALDPKACAQAHVRRFLQGALPKEE